MGAFEYRASPSDSNYALKWLAALMVVGVVLAFLYASSTENLMRTFSVSVLLAGSAVLCGGLFGFLFGIPRVINATDDGKMNDGRRYRSNTNLEQISDWLTKILVGVGLTKLATAPDFLRQLVRDVAPTIGDDSSARLLVAALLVSYVLAGFGSVYVWTRLYFRQALEEADQNLVRALQENQEWNAVAQSLLHEALSPSTDAPRVEDKKLAEAFEKAGPDTRVAAFMQARTFRQVNWRDNNDRVARAIPVFRALIAADTKEIERHRIHGQLAYALKDQDVPEYEAALKEFETAIELRDESGKKGTYQLYELSRAFCRIMLDPALETGKASAPELAKSVRTDLAAIASPGVLRIRADMPEIEAWEKRNPSP